MLIISNELYDKTDFPLMSDKFIEFCVVFAVNCRKLAFNFFFLQPRSSHKIPFTNLYLYIILLIVRLVNTVNNFERAIIMAENTIPNDPMILLSFVNTKLRDFYPSLDKMCDAVCNR